VSGRTVPSSDVDLFTDANILEPYDAYRELRDAGPIVWLSRQRVWAVARYDVVRHVLRDARAFTSLGGVALNEPLNAMLCGTTLASDPPEHDVLRKVVAGALTPRAMAERARMIEECADAIVARVVDRGRFDAVSDLARVLALGVVPDFIGLPVHGRDRMLAWASAMFNAIGPLNDRAREGFSLLQDMAEYAEGRVALRDLCPGSLGAGVLAAADAGRIRRDQCAGLLIDYLAPSLDTTIGALATSIWLLARHPEQWDRVRADPSLVPNAYNESLRIESPVRGFCRHVARPTEFEGAELDRGDKVLVLFAAANRDERKWTDPDLFDVTRRCADHVAFGHGIHGCAGQALARMQAHAVLRALIRRVGRLELVDSTRTINNITRSFASVHVEVRR
jgi:cytochrome P450